MGGATAGTMLALHGMKVEVLAFFSYSSLMRCSVECEVSITNPEVLILSTQPDPMNPGKDKIEVMLLFSFNHTCGCYYGGSPEGVGEFEHGLGGTCTVEGAPEGNQWKIDWKGFGGVGADADPPEANLEVDNGSFDLTNQPQIDPAKCNASEQMQTLWSFWVPTGQTAAIWIYFNGQPIGNANNADEPE